jgi:hypothetical protein
LVLFNFEKYLAFFAILNLKSPVKKRTFSSFFIPIMSV